VQRSAQLPTDRIFFASVDAPLILSHQVRQFDRDERVDPLEIVVFYNRGS